MIFSHSKDEAWSQYKHLHGLGNLKKTSILNGKWSEIIDDRKERTKGKTRVKLEWEKVLNHIQVMTSPCEVKYMGLH